MKKLLPLIILVCFLGTSSAFAGLVTYNLSGEVTEITKSGITSVGVGDHFDAELTIIGASADINPSSDSGAYRVSWLGEVRIGSSTIILDNVSNPPTGFLTTRPGRTTVPELELSMSFPEQILFDGFQLNNFNSHMFNTVTPGLSDDSLLGTRNFTLNPPFTSNLFSIQFSQSGQVNSRLDSFSVYASVPEPGTVTLLGIALIALLYRRVRKRHPIELNWVVHASTEGLHP